LGLVAWCVGAFFVSTLLWVVALFAFFRKFSQQTFAVPPTGSSVLISGCDTGFGYLTSLEMGKLGYRVFAGVLSEASGEVLKKEFAESTKKIDGGSITPLVFNVTNDAQLDATFQRLADELKNGGLDLLCNNAGIARGGPLELIPFQDVVLTIQVNLIGHMNVVQRALPLMRKSKTPRIVNITSIAGVMGAPQLSAYCASKFGLEGVSDCLRRELNHLNFSVSAIEPGFARTPMITGPANKEKSDQMWNSATEDQHKAYSLFSSGRDEAHQRVVNSAIDPMDVVNQIVHAFTSPHPRVRYPVGRLAQIISVLLWALPTPLVDSIFSRSLTRL